jgi:LytS/YehU family sensor histidine kinase
LIENAIKHNQFTEADPLVINIWLNGVFLNVANNVHTKPYLVESTNIGLKNLSTRYKLTCNKDIIVNMAKEKFIVKLPIIQ